MQGRGYLGFFFFVAQEVDMGRLVGYCHAGKGCLENYERAK